MPDPFLSPGLSGHSLGRRLKAMGHGHRSLCPEKLPPVLFILGWHAARYWLPLFCVFMWAVPWVLIPGPLSVKSGQPQLDPFCPVRPSAFSFLVGITPASGCCFCLNLTPFALSLNRPLSPFQKFPSSKHRKLGPEGNLG